MEKNIIYYYDIDDEFINKYTVDIDSEKLKKLRYDIINNCSIILHKKYETIEEPNYFDIDHYRNYHSKKLGLISTNDFHEPDKMNYLVEYDYYKHSKLVELIDRLLNGDTQVIDKLEDTNFLNSRSIYMDEQGLQNKINELITNGKYDEIKTLVDEELENAQIRYNEILALENKYFLEIKECIFLELYDQIELEVFNNMRKFFSESNNSKNVSSGLVKVLKPSTK